ncbi:chaplin [Streptomyces albofaciens JCM 4342]|uniref:chaplin n=1 Tax=Streptomyces albofaciens TaxID=66866 RepID=UPI00123A6215|nr:chaplin [Streptomyces albofaciens]KAA6222661.1 chaplin [Streptomyces albofaciens JCM 4342]
MKNIKKAVAVTIATGGLAFAGAGAACAQGIAQGHAVNSPGVLSGNLLQVPVHVPVNVTGNTVTVIGALNPAFGNRSHNS